jgi:hypothetical protein
VRRSPHEGNRENGAIVLREHDQDTQAKRSGITAHLDDMNLIANTIVARSPVTAASEVVHTEAPN